MKTSSPKVRAFVTQLAISETKRDPVPSGFAEEMLRAPTKLRTLLLIN
jgi:hypothetical protein